MSILINIFFIIGLDLDPALQSGIMFYNNGFYEEAITEYKRYIFLNPEGDQTSDAYYRMASVYRENLNWSQSIDAFRMAVQTAYSDNLRYRAELALAVTYIASGNYSAAEIVCLKIELGMPPDPIKERAALLRAIATMYAKKWDHAQEAFDTYFSSHPDPEMQIKVDSLFREIKKFHYLSPESAKQLSAIIPGLGQMYAGDWGNGLNAFLLNGSMIAWMGYKVFNHYFSDAWTIYYFLFRRYYAGNMYNAERIAEEHNDALDRKQAERILQLFLEE